MSMHICHKKSDEQTISYTEQTISRTEQVHRFNSLLATNEVYKGQLS